jgi:hypothetical protein
VIVRTPRRDALRAFLRERRIFAPVHWLDAGPASDGLLSLPVDQRYGPAEMDRIARAVRDFASLP